MTDHSKRDVSKLKPCPFCGSTPDEPIDATRILGVWRIIHRCPVFGPLVVERSTPEAAVAIWNRRTGTAP